MPGFFNQKNSWLARLQVYNLGVAACVALDLATNAESTFSEIAPDMLIHMFTAFNLGEEASISRAFGSAALNIARIGAIYSGVTSATTSFSLAFNMLDVVGHTVNTFASLSTRERLKVEGDGEPATLAPQ